MRIFRVITAAAVTAAVTATVTATAIALPAQAETESAACPTPSKAELKRSKTDQPPRGAKAVKGVRVGHLPKGFAYGEVVASRHNGLTEYGYRWSDNRDDVDVRHRALWVRVVCWPKARGLGQLRTVPVATGGFTREAKTVTLGGRKVLRQESDGALGHGRLVGWVERSGVVVTVLASQPLVPELDKIVRGIKL